MNLELFNEFDSFKSRGLKKQASSAISRFIESFESLDEKAAWTKSYLSSLPEGSHEKLRHELFEEVIFPVLLEGYSDKDLWSCLMLVRFIRNLYQSKELHKQLDYITDFRLLKECYKVNPDHRITKEKLLSIQVDWFRHCEHEWPSGILYGMDGATEEQINEILSELALAREFDTNGAYSSFFDSFEEKINSYKSRWS